MPSEGLSASALSVAVRSEEEAEMLDGRKCLGRVEFLRLLFLNFGLGEGDRSELKLAIGEGMIGWTG